jgi:hypothetical protein
VVGVFAEHDSLLQRLDVLQGRVVGDSPVSQSGVTLTVSNTQDVRVLPWACLGQTSVLAEIVIVQLVD